MITTILLHLNPGFLPTWMIPVISIVGGLICGFVWWLGTNDRTLFNSIKTNN